MYFKKLEISGFKSFAEKTTLHFEPGITAIVGPNGCGKSNIFDSVRWCLGEQSIKSLRGAKMEDVIFNGTETVPAQNVAEVSLTISNEAKILPIDYQEVTITRRLFRSGESEYLINNNTVRLKDINELLMGTGIGAESYSLVEQGKIDLVISSKPEDRRFVFDEATGVSKYKAKKKEAMKKLEETDNNLLRINDIITEVKRQIGSIERQASKARRYKEIFEKLKISELKYSSLELKTAKSELAVLNEIAKKSAQEESGLNDQLQNLDGKLILQKNELQELDAKITQTKEEITNLENANIRDSQHIHLNLERIVDLNKHAEILSAQKEQLKSKIANHEKNIAEISAQLASLLEVACGQEAHLKAKKEALDGLEKEIEAAQSENKALKNRIFEQNISTTKINNLLNGNASALHTFLARQRRLETEIVKTQEENTELLKNLQALNIEISAQKAKISSKTSQSEALKNQKTVLENSLKKLEEDLRKSENEKLSMLSQVEFLKELKLKYDNMPEAKNGIFEISEIPAEKISGIIARAREVTYQKNTKTYRIACELKFVSFDLQTLETKIEEIARAIEALIRSMSEKEKELMQKIKELETLEMELQQERYNVTNKEAVSSNFSDNVKKIQDELSLITLELTEVNEESALAKQNDEKYKKDLEVINRDIRSCEEQLNQNTNKINASSSIRENILVEIAQLETEIANQKIKEDSIKSNLNFFKDTLAQDEHALNQDDREVADSLKKIEELNQEILTLEIDNQTHGDEIETKTKELCHLSQVRTEEINSLDFTQKKIIDLEERIDKTKEDNHRYQMQEQELNFKYANIKNRILTTYNVDLEETPLPPEMLEALNTEELQTEITTFKEKVASFGTVNLVAIEELEELKNRHDFLTQQQNDLVQAKESLKNAILKINRTTRKMFLETFQIVTEEFKNYFKILFGGGEAKLFLLDEEDVLESGIEIICRPPGKKLQNITLLSGGEKALSAIALIFAIFKTKPSPFCVLDEIDAALDESNIDRFSKMLTDFSKTSQFITITHNKKTISCANVMYGITMELSGMSKIVSVKLRENEHTKVPKHPSSPNPNAKEEQQLSRDASMMETP
jgi:chromosome segregation protein